MNRNYLLSLSLQSIPGNEEMTRKTYFLFTSCFYMLKVISVCVCWREFQYLLERLAGRDPCKWCFSANLLFVVHLWILHWKCCKQNLCPFWAPSPPYQQTTKCCFTINFTLYSLFHLLICISLTIAGRKIFRKVSLHFSDSPAGYGKAKENEQLNVVWNSKWIQQGRVNESEFKNTRGSIEKESQKTGK